MKQYSQKAKERSVFRLTSEEIELFKAILAELKEIRKAIEKVENAIAIYS